MWICCIALANNLKICCMLRSMRGMKDAYWFDDKNRMAREIRKNIATGDCILFKGSRGMRLEEVIYQIYRES